MSEALNPFQSPATSTGVVQPLKIVKRFRLIELLVVVAIIGVSNGDGTVEVVARGRVEDLQKLATALKRGPLTARVTSVQEAPGFLAASMEGFRVEHGS